MLTFDDFKNQYEKTGIVPLTLSKRTKPLNDGALDREYQKYLVKIEKQENRRKEKMSNVKPKKVSKHIDEEKAFIQEVRERDGDCVLTERLDMDAYRLVKNNDTFKQGILDVAHIISRARSPKLKYDPENAVLLNRLFHERIDGYKHPITGTDITEEQREKWLEILVGSERWNRLQDKFRKENT